MGISDSTLRRHNNGHGMLSSFSATDWPEPSSHPPDNYHVRLGKGIHNRPLAARHQLASSRQYGLSNRLKLRKRKDGDRASHWRRDKSNRSMSPSIESPKVSPGLRSPESKRDPDWKPTPKGPFKSVPLGSAAGSTGTNVCRKCRKLLQGSEKGRNRNSFKHYPSARELKDSAVICQLCALFCISLKGSTTRTMGHMSGFRLQTISSREQAILDSTRIQVEILDSVIPYSPQLPFRFLKPRSGLGGNARFGKTIAISQEESVSKYLENIGHSSVLRRSQGKKPGRRQDLLTIKNWLIDCGCHAACQSVSSILPTRVIDVRSLRLYVSKQDEQGLYVALSYCWGKTSTIKTTMENYEARQHRLLIDSETLPKTFKHSIWATRQLGFRYLWIDALCIIQGDQGDWQSESAKMATVFGNAALTFAATDSSHCQGGLFHGQGPGLHQDFFAWKSSAALRSGGCLSYAYGERIGDEIEAQIDRSPLNQRGWVFQEGILSRRIVHFSEAQLIWECRSHMATGDGVLILDKRHLLRPFSELNAVSAEERRAGPHKRWKLVAEGYSRRHFTNMKDRLAALAGITRRYQDLFGDTPLLGLWRGSIAAGLLWRVDSPGRRIHPTILPNVPSWSWLSIDAPVTLVCDDERRRKPKVRVINAPDIKWESTPMTSNVRKAELELKGAVVPKDQLTSRAQFWFDEGPRLSDQEIECLEILKISRTVYPGANFGSNSSTAVQVAVTTTYFLMLVRSPEHEGHIRVGMGSFEEGGLYSSMDPPSPFTDADRIAVDLV